MKSQKRLLSLLLTILLAVLLTACDGSNSQAQGRNSSNQAKSANAALVSGMFFNSVKQNRAMGRQTIQIDGDTYIKVGSFTGSSVQNTNMFQVNGKVGLVWQCTYSVAEPFLVEITQFVLNGYDQPLALGVDDTSSACMGQTVTDFSGQQFTGYLQVTAIGPWAIDVYTLE